MQGLRRTMSSNKYRSEIRTEPKNNKLTDPTFRNINRLFVVSFKNGDDDPKRNSCDEYYMPLVENKDFNTVIDNKSCSDQSAKSKQEVHEKLVQMARSNDYTTRNLLDHSYHQNYHKRIGIDLLRQSNTTILQQINFTAKLGKDDSATIFL